MITTIRIKDLIKYLVILITVLFTIIAITRFFIVRKEKNKKFESSNFKLIKNDNTFLSCIDMSIPISKSLDIKGDNKKDEDKKSITRENMFSSRSGLLRILDIELPNVESTEENIKDSNKIEENKNLDNNEEEKTEERIEIKDTYTNQYKSVKVKNLTDIRLTEEILKPDYIPKNKKNIIIYHTHTCESYTQTDKNQYKPSGNYRTTDLKYSVVRVRR